MAWHESQAHGEPSPLLKKQGRFMRLFFAKGFAVVALLVALVWGAVRYCVHMPGSNWQDVPPPLTPEQSALAVRLHHHVAELAAQERNNLKQNRLLPAKVYIAIQWEQMGYQPQAQEYLVNGVAYQNLQVILPGDGKHADIVVVGAHYDSVEGSPGADDNASGVAALLEVSRALAGRTFARPIHLVAFVNEEAPFYATQDMGSEQYVHHLQAQRVPVYGMWSLEMLGYYSDQPGSQTYPPVFSWFYPDTGNFIGFVGNLASRDWVHRSIATFRQHGRIPSAGVAAPDVIPPLGWSDHAPFWAAGYPALMITDTAMFRNPHYHTAQDTPDTLDYARMTHVVLGLTAALQQLANE